MLKNLTWFAAGFITMGITGVAGSFMMAKLDPAAFDEVCNAYKS